MLTKRAQILFEETLWKKLVHLASEKKTSVGSLIRKAIEEKYAPKADLEQRRKTINTIYRLKEKYQVKPSKKKEDTVSIIKRMREERTKHIIDVLAKSHESNS